MIRLKISTKILLYFLLVSLLPLVVSTYILVGAANNQLLSVTAAKQAAVANDLANQVNDYLQTKVNTLVNLSELFSSASINQSDADQDLAVALNRDQDMQRIAEVDSVGHDQTVFDRTGQVFNLLNESSSDAFKAVNFNGGPYVSFVSYNTAHQPIITIAAPILPSNFVNHLSDLSNANFGTYNPVVGINGAVIASYNMSNLWQSVLSTKVGQHGYAYVVDSLGNLVAHPNSSFYASHPKLSNVQAVNNFLHGNLATKTTVSETGQKVVSTPRAVKSSGWGVIVEEPVNSVYSAINSYINLATVIGLTAVAFSIALSFFFRRQLIVPLRKLSAAAKRFGKGHFDQAIKINSNDELHDLAEAFNTMGQGIKRLIGDLQANNINLKVEQSKLSNIISSVSDGILAVDTQGKIVTANPPAAKLVNKTAEELVGQRMVELYNWQSDNQPLLPELSKPGLYHYSDLVLSRGQNVAYLDLVVSVIAHKDSDVAAIITINDQTQSRELDFMKLDFVAIAAHELRTPLTVVRGYLDMLNVEAIKKLTLSSLENLQKALEGTNQLRDLINKLLNIARIERGEMEIFIEKLNIAKLLKDNVRQHESQAAEKEQRLILIADTEKAVYVPADPSSITEVLNNLIGNAIKYTDKNGRIEVKLMIGTSEVKVEVVDNGPGVPEELRDRLFTKFYRAERSLIAGTRGTGLGLFISKTIIELQHGTIGLIDTPHGSNFYFTLPIYDPTKYDKLIPRQKQLGGIHGWFKKRDDRRR